MFVLYFQILYIKHAIPLCIETNGFRLSNILFARDVSSIPGSSKNVPIAGLMV